ncbi:SOS response-associated peptidase [Brucella anthropi]|uniref:SOS response-associated peptidase n=1 Tax=Brucella anthropi TaxID=529 RepID=UPI000E9181B7|nr:SOS response-associated peptidase [Brucella anthropi]KAB2785392.1 SOS response-associated peptidase [Brucella anthropi]QOD66951.1 SOS response-associated peptidase [Ochrobactrum sp. MT180101]HBQ34952.1 SOS response-associated peptidase [Brucella anthropi]
MYGRFAQAYAHEDLQSMYNPISTSRPLQRTQPVRPKQNVGVVMEKDSQIAYRQMRWGLIPGWWRDNPDTVPLALYADSETIDTKRMFRNAFFRKRCIIPASCFFGWSVSGRVENKWKIFSKEGRLLSFAGVYEIWLDKEIGKSVWSCAVITSNANRYLQSFQERMPAILGQDDWKSWLSEPNNDLLIPNEEVELAVSSVATVRSRYRPA